MTASIFKEKYADYVADGTVAISLTFGEDF